jgi:glycosyltransferase involved in cell wall biosynthesis
MKIIHFISGLQSGGTEKNLHKLTTKKDHSNIIFSFTKLNFFFKQRKQKLYLPKKNNFFSSLKQLSKIPAVLHKEKPDIVYCWMIHANVIAGLISYFCGYKKIVWNLRSSGQEYSLKKKNFFLFIILIIFSYFIPKIIVFNSNLSLKNYRKNFLSKKNNQIIFNGFEKKKFINKTYTKTIHYLCVARNHKIKNHQLLLDAFYLFNKNFSSWKLTLVGRGINLLRNKVKNNPKYSEIQNKIIFLNEKKNLEPFYRKSNFVILSSKAESFPNIVGEAMSYGTPVISTNVGDVEKLILNKNFLVRFQNEISFFKSLMNSSRLYLKKKNYIIYCKKNKDFIDKNFSINNMLNRFKIINKKLF